MSKIEVEFAFEVGQMVCVRQDTPRARELFGRDAPKTKPPQVIVERLAQQCHGGIQKLYAIRAYTPTGAILIHYTEIELEAAPS